MELGENLDALESAELREYAASLQHLANLALYLAQAKELRLAGNIQAAIAQEKVADSFYKTLPDWCKTW
jgi:hypothetical protein